jgi:hypothetical protein
MKIAIPMGSLRLTVQTSHLLRDPGNLIETDVPSIMPEIEPRAKIASTGDLEGRVLAIPWIVETLLLYRYSLTCEGISPSTSISAQSKPNEPLLIEASMIIPKGTASFMLSI